MTAAPKSRPAAPLVIRDHRPATPNPEAKRAALALIGPIPPRSPAQAAD